MGDQAPRCRQGLTYPRRAGAMLVAISVVLLTTACSSDPGGDAAPAAACTLPPEVEVPKDIPADFPWPEKVSLTEAQTTKRFVALAGFGEGSVKEYFESARAELSDRDFDIINTDFEGFEAELYFAKGNSLAGITALREGPCDGYVKVNVVYDPLETAEGREAVRKTRRLTGGGSKSSPGG